MTTLADSDVLIVQLDDEASTNPDLLVPPSQRDFGATPDIARRNVEIRVGNRPTALDLACLYKATGQKLPPELELYTSYRLWLLNHHVSIVRRPGIEFVTRFGFEVRFPERPRVTVVSLFPETRFVTRGTIDASARLVAGINFKGQAATPTIAAAVPSTAGLISLGGDGGAQVDVSGKLVLSVSCRSR